jgi:oxalate---CoA ligase
MAMATMEATTLTALLKEAVAAFPTRRVVVVPGRLELTHAALDALIDAAAAQLAADARFLPGHVVALSFPTPSRFVSFRIRSIMFLPARRRAPE